MFLIRQKLRISAWLGYNYKVWVKLVKAVLPFYAFGEST